MASAAFRISVVVSSVLVLAIGAVLAALGIWVFIANDGLAQLGSIEDDGKYSKDLSKPGLLESAAVIAIIDGVLMVMVGMSAIYGIWKEARCILGLCAAFLIVLLMLDIVIIVLTGVTKERTDDHLEDALFEALQFQYEGIVASGNDFSRTFDVAQVTFECCGVNDSSNALMSSQTWVDKASLKVPKTCCKLKDKDDYLDSDVFQFVNIACARNLSLGFYHTEPCLEYIREWLEEKLFILLGWSVVSFVFQLITLLLAIAVTPRLSDGQPTHKTYHYR